MSTETYFWNDSHTSLVRFYYLRLESVSISIYIVYSN